MAVGSLRYCPMNGRFWLAGGLAGEWWFGGCAGRIWRFWTLEGWTGVMAQRKYDDLSREEMVRLLEARDRRDATRFGLVWEANEVEREKALNDDFVALDLDRELSCGKERNGQ